MQIGDLAFDVFRGPQGLMLKCTQIRARSAVEGVVKPEDLARLGVWFSPSVPLTDNGLDIEMVDRIVNAGLRALAKNLHPDAGGSNEAMGILNNTADQIRERLR